MTEVDFKSLILHWKKVKILINSRLCYTLHIHIKISREITKRIDMEIITPKIVHRVKLNPKENRKEGKEIEKLKIEKSK